MTYVLTPEQKARKAANHKVWYQAHRPPPKPRVVKEPKPVKELKPKKPKPKKPTMSPEEKLARKAAYRREWMAIHHPPKPRVVREPKPQEVKEPKRPCVHWWLVPGDRTARLTGILRRRFPLAIGRPSVCKKCGEETVLAEWVRGQQYSGMKLAPEEAAAEVTK